MTTATAAPASPRKRARSTTKKSPKRIGKPLTKKPTISLTTFVANIFYGVFIQDDDSIAEVVYTKNWSPDVKETNDGNPLNFKQFHAFLFKTRAEITDRQLLSQSFVVARADEEGRSGQVAHTSHWTGVKDGESVKGTIVSVLKIVCVPGKENGPDIRTVKTESFVLNVEKE